jgi:hypothetical protein
MIFEQQTYRCWAYLVGMVDSARLAWKQQSSSRTAPKTHDYELQEFEERLLYSATPLAVALPGAAAGHGQHTLSRDALPNCGAQSPEHTVKVDSTPLLPSNSRAGQTKCAVNGTDSTAFAVSSVTVASPAILGRASPGAAPTPATLNVILIDQTLADHNSLTRAAAPGAVVIQYSSLSDTATQVLDRVIAASSAAHEQISSLSILSHGDPGKFELGNQWVSTETVGALQAEWQALRQHLQPGGNIYIFGCDTGDHSAGGQILVDQLAQRTGSNVFASNNITGAGGDWKLEVASTGAQREREAGLAIPLDTSVLADYRYALAAPVVNLNTGSLSYTENQAATALAPNLALSGGATNSTSATISISGNYASGEDSLSFTSSSGITGSWNATTGALTLTGNTGQTQWQTVLRSVKYYNSSSNPSSATRTVAFQITDSNNAVSAQQTMTVAVTPVNNAPVLSGANNFTTITEDQAANGGNPVSDLIAGKVADVDTVVRGIAVTGLSSSTGTWQYSLDSGTTWNTVGTVSNTSALLLRSTDTLRFVPDGKNGTTASVTFRAWDQTLGTAGNKVSTATSGGTTAFSTATATSTITVTSLNDAPVLTGAVNFTTITEDQTTNSGNLVSTLITSKVTDVDTGAVQGIAVTGLNSSTGAWQYSLDNGTTWNAVGTVASNSALLLRSSDKLRFVPDGMNGTLASVTYCAWDRTGGTAGSMADTTTNGGTTAFSTATATSTITVTSVNDAPVLSGANNFTTIGEDQTTNSGNLVSTLIAGKVTDVDTGAVQGIAVTALNSSTGTWQYSLDSGTTWSALGAVSNTSALLLRSTDQLRFVPDGKNGTTASLTFRTWDQTSGTAGNKVSTATSGGTTAFSTATATSTITVTSLNDAPVLTGAVNFTTITEDQTTNAGNLVSTLITGKVTDVDTGAVQGIAVTGLNSSTGTWQYSLDNGTTWNAVGTVSSNSALLLRSTDKLRFVPDGMNGTTASVTFCAWDQIGGTAGSMADTTTNGGTTAFSTATATSTITVTSVNDAPVLSGANNFTTISEDQTTNSGNLVSTLITGKVTDVDTGAVQGIAVTALNSSTGTWQYSLDNGTTWNALGAVSNTSALLLRSTDTLRFVPDGKNGTTASLTFRAWDQTSGTAGSKVSTTTNGGTTAFSTATATSTITVTSLNDAPVLSGANNFTTITEDQSTNAGNLVSTLITGKVTDVDTGAVQGIAVTGLNSSTGTWQYSLDNGTTWNAVGTVASNSALLLRSTDRLRFVPDGMNGTTASVTYCAWDQTSGAAGSTADTTTNGGTTAFSTATATSTITVTSVNDAPVLSGANNFTTITEDQTTNSGDLVSTLISGKVTDVDTGALQGIAVTSLNSSTGTWQYSLNNGTTWNAVGTVASTSALLLRSTDQLRFVPDGKNGTTASVTFCAWDQTSGTAGSKVSTTTNGGTTAFSTATATPTITVTSLNDAPVLSGANNFTTITEDQTTNAGNLVSTLITGKVTDVDTGAVQGIAVTGLNSSTGTWQYSLDNGTTWNAVGTVSSNSALLLRSTDKLRFVPDGMNGTTASVTYCAWDQTSGAAGGTADTTTNGGTTAFSTATATATITVTSVNDAPVLSGANNFTTITEDQTANAGNLVSDLIAGKVSDVDTGAVQGIAVTGLSSSTGTWQYSLNNGTTWNAVGTVSSNSALLLRSTDMLRFVPDGKNGTTASATFRAWDQSSGTAGSKVSTATSGGTTAFSTATATSTITVTSVNDAPVLTGVNNFTTITEDQTTNAGNLVSTLITGKVTDVDAGTVQGIAVTGLISSTGTWQYSLDNGTTWNAVGTVASNSALLLRSIDKLRLVPNGMNGTTASVTFCAWDQSNGAAGSAADTTTNGGTTAFSTATATSTITVTSVNDAPILSGANNFATITEDQNTNSGNLVSDLITGKVTDVDPGAVQGIAVTGLNSSTGTWQYSLNNGTTWNAVGTVSSNSALLLRSTDMLRFVPDGKNGTTASVTFRAWDQTSGAAGSKVSTATSGGTAAFSTATATSTITVTSLNDAPVLSEANNFTTITEDQTTNSGDLVSTLVAGKVTDVDTGAVQGIAVTGLNSSTGTWQYSLDNGTTWNVVGTVSDNSALLLRSSDKLRFVPDGINGTTASLSFRAWDQTSGTAGSTADTTANGGTTAFSTATATSNITVTDVNDAPVISGANNFATITEDQTANSGDLVSDLIAGKVSDVDPGAVQGIAVTGLNSSTGTWQFSLDNGTTWNAVGTVADSSALLLRSSDKLRFVPDGMNGTTASLSFRAWDQTSGTAGNTADTTPNGGSTAYSTATATSTITVTNVNDAPVLSGANNFATITEDQTANSGNPVSDLIADKLSDVDTGAVRGIAVTGLNSSTGTWQYSLDNGTTWKAVGTVSDNSALLLLSTDKLRLVPDGMNGTTASLSFRAWDQTSGTAGSTADTTTNGGTTAFSTATATSNITVTDVNDAPVLSGANDFSTITEDQTTNSGNLVSELIAGKVTDVDTGAVQGIAVTGLNRSTGAWQYSLDNGTTWNAVGTVADNSALLLRSTDKLRFVPDGMNGTTASLSFRAWDQSSGTAGNTADTTSNDGTTAFSTATATSNITVTDVNDAPVLSGVNDFSTIAEGQIANSGNLVSELIAGKVTDVDTGAVQGIAVTGLNNSTGTWQYSLDNGTTWNAVGTVADNSALLLRSTDKLRFVPGVMNGPTASLNFRAWDQTGGAAGNQADTTLNGGTTAFSSTTATAKITITSINDAVLNSGQKPISLDNYDSEPTSATQEHESAIENLATRSTPILAESGNPRVQGNSSRRQQMLAKADDAGKTASISSTEIPDAFATIRRSTLDEALGRHGAHPFETRNGASHMLAERRQLPFRAVSFFAASDEMPSLLRTGQLARIPKQQAQAMDHRVYGPPGSSSAVMTLALGAAAGYSVTNIAMCVAGTSLSSSTLALRPLWQSMNPSALAASD